MAQSYLAFSYRFPFLHKFYAPLNHCGVCGDEYFGNVLYFAQDFKTAAAWYAKAAAQGHAESQCDLGVLYKNGSGVAQDFKAAAELFAKAAAQGHDYACYNLGLLYENGEGVAQDFKAAAAWYRNARGVWVAGDSRLSDAPARRDACLARVASAAAASRP